jgi:hypothetical protein
MLVISSLTALRAEGGPTPALSRAAEVAFESARRCDGEGIHKNEVGGVALQRNVGPGALEATGDDAPTESTTGLECLVLALSRRGGV